MDICLCKFIVVFVINKWSEGQKTIACYVPNLFASVLVAIFTVACTVI